MKKKIIFLTISIFLVILILFSSSYALLFKVDETDKQSYTTGILDITSESLSGSVTINNQLPISDSDGENSTPYIFRITNKGNLSYKFNIMLLSTTTDNQIEAQYIKLKVNDNEIVTLNSLTNGVILSDITLKPDEYIDVTLRVWLDINTPNTQIGKTFNAKITTEGQAVYMDMEKITSLTTLTNLGLEESTEIPDFSKTSCSDGCGESTVGIYKTEDDFGDSYYFRGDVENNYVYFAGYYFRIIRINGDGTIRIIYDGTIAHNNGESSTDRIISTSTFNDFSNSNTNIGYMYGTSNATTYDETHKNTSNSTAKTVLDVWYENNIKNTENEKYVVDAIYCNDREVSVGSGIGTTATDYKAWNRFFNNVKPTLKCNQVNDRFAKETKISGVAGNGALTYPIGLITADEVAYAGGVYNTSNSKYYLYTGNTFWTMTPAIFNNGEISSFAMTNSGINYSSTNTIYGIRPVITLSATALNSGTGIKKEPFKNGSVEIKYPLAEKTLINLGLTEKEETLDFSKTSCSDGCDEATVGIYKTEDDFGNSYYFRGDVENNYVLFANKYWRIIRINGDGSIRMIYDGTSVHDNGESSTDRSISTSTFNSLANSNAYVGYMYGKPSATAYDETHENTNDSAIKKVLDAWYENNIKNTDYEKYVVDAIYCNDRSLASGNGAGTNITNYKAWNRISNKSPTLKCSQTNDRFTTSTIIKNTSGNGVLTYPIGLITADEVAYAGGLYETRNTKYYLYMGDWYWTMSPAKYSGSYASELNVYVSGYLINNGVNDTSLHVRPVISISGTALNSGNGTKDNPFKIQ